MARLGGIDTQYFTDEGDPLSYGLLYCYETGTTTPKGTFHDSGLTVPNTWPIELDAIGVPPDVFFSGTAKFVLKDSAGTTLRTLDPVIDNEFLAGDTIILRLGDIDSQFFDQNGDILSLGKLYVYENGTSTPKDTYSDNALTTLNAWPVVLDSNGFLGDVFFEGKARLVLTDQHGVQQRELDNIDTFDISYLPGLIISCPSDVVVTIGEEVSFCVYVDGLPENFTYQWYQGLTLLVGETNACLAKTIVEADDGTSIWVTVTDGESVEQCAYALITIDDTPCTWTAPVAEITAELIWEEDEALPNFDVLGIVGVDVAGRSGKIIANPTVRTLITSDDYGDTWTEYANALPVDPNDPARWLRPTNWQLYNGSWRSHTRSSDPSAANNNSYAASFTGGVFTYGSWEDDRGAPPTYGMVGYRNSRYSSSSMVWDVSGLVAAGRWGSDSAYPGTNIGGTYGNSISIARYSSSYAANTVPAEYGNYLIDNQNCYGLFKIEEGYCLIRHFSQLVGEWYSSDFSSRSQVNTTIPTTLFNAQMTNGVKTVMRPGTSTFRRWYKETSVSPTWTAFDPDTGGTSPSVGLAGYSPQHWLFAKAKTNRLYTSYTTDVDGVATPTRGPEVVLPSNISTSGANETIHWLQYAGDGWWIGYYVRQTDNKINIYRFQYGTYEGPTCK